MSRMSPWVSVHFVLAIFFFFNNFLGLWSLFSINKVWLIGYWLIGICVFAQLSFWFYFLHYGIDSGFVFSFSPLFLMAVVLLVIMAICGVVVNFEVKPVCVYVCVCEREREREREGGGGRERDLLHNLKQRYQTENEVSVSCKSKPFLFLFVYGAVLFSQCRSEKTWFSFLWMIWNSYHHQANSISPSPTWRFLGWKTWKIFMLMLWKLDRYSQAWTLNQKK